MGDVEEGDVCSEGGVDEEQEGEGVDGEGADSGAEGEDSDKRKKKTRTVFSRSQVFQLESTFDVKRYLSSSERASLASSLHLTETQVTSNTSIKSLKTEIGKVRRASFFTKIVQESIL